MTVNEQIHSYTIQQGEFSFRNVGIEGTNQKRPVPSFGAKIEAKGEPKNKSPKRHNLLDSSKVAACCKDKDTPVGKVSFQSSVPLSQVSWHLHYSKEFNIIN